MGKLDQLVKSVFLEETPRIVGDRLVFSVPPETATTEIHADGLLTVVHPDPGLPMPWCLAEGPEVVLEFKMQGDKLDRAEVERARLRRQARQAQRALEFPDDPRVVPLWMVSGYVPQWFSDEVALELVADGMHRVPHEPFWWIASNELPLDPALVPFLVTRTGKRLHELLHWLLRVDVQLCKNLFEVVRMSTSEYEKYDEEIRAVTEEEHRRRLTAFVSGLAHWFGIVEQAEQAVECRVMRQMVLDTLARRGLPLTDPERQRVLAEEDIARLRLWHDRAVDAATVAQVFADDLDAG